MKTLKILVYVLGVAVQKHGGKTPVTLGHLLNIIKMCIRFYTKAEQIEQKQHNKLMSEINPLGQW